MLHLMDAFTDAFASTDWGLVIFSLVFAMFCAAIVLVIAWNIYSLLARKRLYRSYRLSREVTEIIKLDYHNDSCVRFFLSDLTHRKNGNYNSVAAGLLPIQQENLKKWLKAIEEGKDVNPYLQSRCYFAGEKKPQACFFRLVSHNPELGVIHLEKILIRQKANRRSRRFMLSSTDELSSAIKANGYERGALLLFRLNLKRRIRDASGRPINQISSGLASRFRDLLYPFASGNQKLVQYGEGELAIANFDLFDKTQALDFALQVIEAVTKSLPKNRHMESSSYEVTCGVVLFSDLLGESSTILSLASRLAELAYDGKNPVMFFERGKEGLNESELVSGKDDVTRIISERKISTFYRPMYDLTKGRILGYLCQFTPRDTPYNSIEELKAYASRVKQGKTLFSYLTKDTIIAFENQRQYQYQQLFFPIMACEIDPAIKLFTRSQLAKMIGLVLLFKETDLYSESGKSDAEALKEGLKKLKTLGCKIALLAEGQSLLLDDSWHSIADFFLTDFSITEGGSAKVDMKIRSRLHALVEKLLRYKKPIIATEVGTWNTLELLYRSGLDYVSGNPIGMYETMVKPIADKTKKKLQALIERR